MIDLISLGVRDTYMGYLEYNNIAGHRMEVLTTDVWDFEIAEIDLPRAVWMPPLQRLRLQTKEITLGVDSVDMNGKIDIDIRGFKIKQRATNQRGGGDLEWKLLDFEDQAIFTMAQSWASALGHNRFRFRFRKEDVFIPKMVIYILNSSRLPVRAYTFYGLSFDSYTVNASLSNVDIASRDEVTLKFAYEEWEVTVLNLPQPHTF